MMKFKILMRIYISVIFFLFLILKPTHAQLSKEANQDLERTLIIVCGEYLKGGEFTNKILSVDAKIELNSILKRLAELGLNAKGLVNSENYIGVLREQLSGEIDSNRKCRQKVWGDLLESKKNQEKLNNEVANSSPRFEIERGKSGTTINPILPSENITGRSISLTKFLDVLGETEFHYFFSTSKSCLLEITDPKEVGHKFMYTLISDRGSKIAERRFAGSIRQNTVKIPAGNFDFMMQAKNGAGVYTVTLRAYCP